MLGAIAVPTKLEKKRFGCPLQGGFTGIFFYFGHITAIAFSYIRTVFGASRSMRVGVRLAKQ